MPLATWVAPWRSVILMLWSSAIIIHNNYIVVYSKLKSKGILFKQREVVMIIERIKKLISKITFLKVLICTFIIVALIFYFKAFFTMGVYFNGEFLKKETVSSEIHYKGKTTYGKIQIIVKGLANEQSSVEVDYRFPNNINKKYIVEFKKLSNLEIGMENIEDRYRRHLEIGIESIRDEEGNTIFSEGVYKKNIHYLFDKDRNPFMDDFDQFIVDMEDAYTSNYKVSLNNVVAFATSANDVIRGNFEYFVPAIFLLIFTLIDVTFPLFFFTLKNALSVKDPEPSEFYIFIQKISWYAYPILAIILMIAAL